MKARWQKLAARFEALSRRERALVAAALVGGTLLVGFVLLIDPVAARNKSMRQGIERQSAELAGLQSQLAALENQLRADPDAARKQQIQDLAVSLQDLGKRLRAAENGLVPPERMNSLLEAMLRRHPGLRLVSLKTLKPTGILGVPAAADGKPESAAGSLEIYRHGVELRLEGSFGDLQAYVEQLEKEQPRLLWGEMALRVEEHPRAMLTLVIYTLSAEKAWLAI